MIALHNPQYKEEPESDVPSLRQHAIGMRRQVAGQHAAVAFGPSGRSNRPQSAPAGLGPVPVAAVKGVLPIVRPAGIAELAVVLCAGLWPVELVGEVGVGMEVGGVARGDLVCPTHLASDRVRLEGRGDALAEEVAIRQPLLPSQ